MMARSERRQRAFTLVEMLIAMAVTSLIAIVLWQLFGSGSRAMVYGTWYSARVQELRTTLRIIREDMGKATYPSIIKLSKPRVTVTDNDPNFYIGRHDSPNRTTFPFTGNLLQFHICRPDCSQLAAPNNTPPADILATLVGAGTVARYTRKGQSGTFQPEDEYNPNGTLDTIHDVDWIEIRLNPNKVGDPDGSLAAGDSTGTLSITIHCTYPWDKNKGAEETTNCKLNLKYKTI